MAQLYAELRSMSDEEVIQEYDRQAQHLQPSLDFYRQEITRRQLEKQSQQMLSKTEDMRNMTADIRKWTKLMLWLTVIIAILTAVNVSYLFFN